MSNYKELFEAGKTVKEMKRELKIIIPSIKCRIESGTNFKIIVGENTWCGKTVFGRSYTEGAAWKNAYANLILDPEEI